MKRGEIYYIQSIYQEVGSEQRSGRPAVIVSNNNNNNSEVVEVVYMTTQPKNDLPTHVLTRSSALPSTILCEQICSVSTQRIGDYIGKLTEQEEKELDIALAISLGLGRDAMKATREPTVEELAAIRESVRAELLAEMEPETPNNPQTPKKAKTKAVPDAQAIKTETERNLYQMFCGELLEILKGGPRE